MFCPKINKNIAEDSSDCETLLKESLNQTPNEKDDSLTVSDSIAERIENDGTVNEDRLTCYDDYWIEKLATLDRTHTQDKLNLDKAEAIMNKLTAYTHYRSSDPCEKDAMKLMRCYEMFDGQIIKCNDYAQNFARCVDKSLENAITKSDSSKQSSDYTKKMTYTEKFEEGF